MAAITGKQLREAREARRERTAKERESRPRAGTPVWSTPKAGTMIVQFIANPDLDVTDFESLATNYREVYCGNFKHVDGNWEAGPYEGQPRNEIPGGFRDVVVDDWDIVFEAGRPYIKYLNQDMIDLGKGEVDLLTEILDGSTLQKWAKDDKGNPMPNWKSLVNIIVHEWPENDDKRIPSEGDHLLLKFREADWAKRIVPMLETVSSAGVDVFDHTWAITFVPANQKKNTPREVKIAMSDVDAVNIEVEPFSAEEHLTTAKAAFVAIARAALADETSESELVVPDFLPKDKIPYGQMSSQRLRSLLTKAGVEVPKGTNQAALVELAKEHL